MVNVTAASHLAVESADMPRFGGPGLKKKGCTYPSVQTFHCHNSWHI